MDFRARFHARIVLFVRVRHVIGVCVQYELGIVVVRELVRERLPDRLRIPSIGRGRETPPGTLPEVNASGRISQVYRGWGRGELRIHFIDRIECNDPDDVFFVELRGNHQRDFPPQRMPDDAVVPLLLRVVLEEIRMLPRRANGGHRVAYAHSHLVVTPLRMEGIRAQAMKSDDELIRPQQCDDRRFVTLELRSDPQYARSRQENGDARGGPLGLSDGNVVEFLADGSFRRSCRFDVRLGRGVVTTIDVVHPAYPHQAEGCDARELDDALHAGCTVVGVVH